MNGERLEFEDGAGARWVVRCFPHGEWPQLPVWPVSTRCATPVGEYDRGENWHGDLTETFYVSWNNDQEFEAAVLWVEDSGSQREDNAGRVLPAVLLLVQENADRFEASAPNLEAATRALLYAYFRSMREWFAEDEDRELVFPETLIDFAAAGLRGEPCPVVGDPGFTE